VKKEKHISKKSKKEKKQKKIAIMGEIQKKLKEMC